MNAALDAMLERALRHRGDPQRSHARCVASRLSPTGLRPLDDFFGS